MTEQTTPLGALVGDGQPSRAPRAFIALGAVIVVLAGLYVAAQWLYADKIPPGAQVVGVDIGGMDTASAANLLDASLAAATRQPIIVTAGSARGTLDPAESGLAFDSAATVAQFTGFSLAPTDLWQHIAGGPEHGPVVTVDEAKLEAAITALAAKLVVAPVDGSVSFVDAQPVRTQAVDGTTVQIAAGVEAVRDGWLVTQGQIDLATASVAPTITQAATDAAYAQAQQIAAGPVTVLIGGQRPALPAATLISAVTFQKVGAELKPVFDAAALAQGVLDRTVDLLTEPTDASFVFQDGAPVILGGDPGTSIDPAAVAAGVEQAVAAVDRT
jgi:hypothetical protein